MKEEKCTEFENIKQATPFHVCPDIFVVKIGGKQFVHAFGDTGSYPDFCTEEFANAFEQKTRGQKYRYMRVNRI